MPLLGFDVTAAAQAYSGVSGILAGFAITVLVLLIEHVLTDEADEDVREDFQRALPLSAM